MIKINNKKKLEEQFANDFSSPVYPILANTYLIEGDLKRAKKVCEIGLDHNPYNIDGKYVLAKIALEENKLILVEKLLKEVVDNNPAHFNAMRLLINTEIKLNRSSNTIQNYIMMLLKFLPNDIQCITWLDQILKSNSLSKKTTSKGNIGKDFKNVNPIKLEPTYKVVTSMATFSMVQILKSQKHYIQALAVLDSLIKKGEDKNKIAKEKLTIEKLLESSNL
tara:strand:- start:626 stop:1291 length:666 start_codon:yes stop_codon:yes gene_type:complete